LFVVFAVAIGLIGATYHFLSDFIAGAFVGVSTGWMTTTLWQTRGLNGGTNRKSGNRSDMYS
jgi:membrane-associated phospholipid phosphatase